MSALAPTAPPAEQPTADELLTAVCDWLCDRSQQVYQGQVHRTHTAESAALYEAANALRLNVPELRRRVEAMRRDREAPMD